jgi:hypothetical protein
MAFVVMTTHLVHATLGSTPGTSGRDLYKRVYNPQVGDLVVEQSTAGRSFYKGPDEGVAWCKGFGVLIEHREEWWLTDEEWAHAQLEDEYEHRRTDYAWYVQFGPDPTDICRWVNCEFWAVPIDPWERFLIPPSMRDNVDPEVLARRIGLVDMLVDP